MSVMSAPSPRPGTRDRGSVLVLVLAFVVVGSLIVVPMLTYASTVLRVNTVMVEKTEEVEFVRAGARVAAAEPADLFERCTTSAWVAIPTPAVSTTSTCRQIGEVGVIDELEIPYGAVAVQLGQTVPSSFAGTTMAPPTTATNTWWGTGSDMSCTTWCNNPKSSTVWLPDLPERATTIQEATGYLMPAPRSCRVYFPGTYDSPIVVADNTYFTSGVYYFTKNVTIVGGADAVAGYGLAAGCVGDVEAVLDMPPNPLPSRLNVEGLGATFIFGDDARLIVDNTKMRNTAGTLVPNSENRPLRFEINQRYVETATDADARVSIISVNGDRDTVPTTTVGPLDVPGVLTMPESMVRTSSNSRVTATSKNLMPSIHTAEPRVPEAPKSVSATALYEPTATTKGAAGISWAAPVGNDEGGSTITLYTATASPGGRTCRTDGATTCVIRGLTPGTAYTVTVVATNAIGASVASAPVTVTPTNTSATIGGTSLIAPTNVKVAEPVTYLDAAAVSWMAPVSNAPIVRYDVKVYRAYLDITSAEVLEPVAGGCSTTSFRNTPAATTCDVTGLPPVDTTPAMAPGGGTYLGYRFTVSATAAATNFGLPATAVPPADLLGTSPESARTEPPVVAFTGTTAPTPVPAPVWPVAPAYVPDPIVDVNLSNPSNAAVTVAGYVSTPQGRVRVVNPHGRVVDLVGGVVAGSYDVDAASMAQPTTTVGFENVVLQRTIEIRTVGNGRVTSTMRLQINANGADTAVNAWVIQ